MGLLQALKELIFGKPVFPEGMGSGAQPADAASQPAPPPPPEGDGIPFASSIEIRYVNFVGQPRTFVGDAASLRDRGRFISVVVQPRHTRIALKRERIENLTEVEDALAALPAPEEARVLNFHKARGTTSPLYEQLRQKYPDY